MQRLTETTLNRLVTDHNKYVIISASRGDKTIEENNRRFSELKNKVWKAGYSYIPVYGGYIEDSGEVYEKSLVVLPKNKDQDFSQLVDDMISIGKYYEQEAILVKFPDDYPVYYDLITNTYGESFDGELKLNDAAQKYFTSLKKHPRAQRFIYTYLESQPQTIMGAHMRESRGEIIYYDQH